MASNIVSVQPHIAIARGIDACQPGNPFAFLLARQFKLYPDEYDNRFDVSGLLKEGDNEILVVYENLGHAHGYVPMEELSGIREAGLSLTETALTHPLEWEYAADALETVACGPGLRIGSVGEEAFRLLSVHRY